MDSEDLVVDWIHLPVNAAQQFLYESLHDGSLESIQSDLLQRIITLQIDVPHIREYHELNDDIRFIIQLDGVQSARANTWAIWPGAVPEVEGKTFEEQSRLVEEYQAKWREESMSWNDFMAAFLTDSLDIYNAEIACDKSGVCLQIQGALNGEVFNDRSCNFFIRAEQLSIQQSNGKRLTIEGFLQLGRDYWESRGKK